MARFPTRARGSCSFTDMRASRTICRVGGWSGSARHRVSLFDLRGHGPSDGPRGHVNRFADYLDDLARVVESVERLGGKTPLLLFGHSLGSLIALCFVRALPTPSRPWPSAVRPRPQLSCPGRPRAAGARGVPDRTGRAIRKRPLAAMGEPRRGSGGRVCRRSAGLSTTTPRWYTEVTAAQRDLLAHAGEITTAALFLVAGSDRIADHRQSLELFERLGTPAPRKRLQVYPELYHEIFNEIPPARAEVTQDLFSWLDERLALAPAG